MQFPVLFVKVGKEILQDAYRETYAPGAGKTDYCTEMYAWLSITNPVEKINYTAVYSFRKSVRNLQGDELT